jgi:RNA polymerase sigma factor (sigma-70 family)
MAETSLGHLLRYLRRTCTGQSGDLTDSELLERFITQRDPAAFTILVHRHGPMVLSVCHRVLGDGDVAEDAFQATFLVLVQRAARIRNAASLGSWLHGVALRIASRARGHAATRKRCERQCPMRSLSTLFDEIAWQELRQVLDEEIARLPDNYRAAVVLCHLQGKSLAQAAAELGWPRGTLAYRVARARELLRGQLLRRGIDLTVCALAALLGEKARGAILTARLAIGTVQAASRLVAGHAPPSFSHVPGLWAKDAATAMAGGGRILAALVVVLALGGMAIGLLMHGALATDLPPPSADPALAQDQVQHKAVDQYGDPLPAGALRRLGSTRWQHAGGVGFAAFLPDGKSVLSVANDKAIRIWAYPSGKEIRRFGQPELDEAADWKSGQSVSFLDHAKVALTRDGKTVAVSDGGAIKVYEVARGKLLASLPAEAPLGDAPAIAFAPDGTLLAALEGASKIRLWDWARGKEIRSFGNVPLLAVNRFLYNLAPGFSADGSALAATVRLDSKQVAVLVWDPSTGKELHSLATTLEDYNQASAPLFAPSGKALAYAGKIGAIMLVDTATGQQIRHFLCKNRSELARPILFNGDGTKLYSSATYMSSVREWDVATGRPLQELGQSAANNPHLTHHAAMSFWLSLSPDGKTVALADGWHEGCHALTLVDAMSWKKINASVGQAQPIMAVRFSPDGKEVITQGEFTTSDRWDSATGKLIETRSLSDKKFIWINDVSPDGGVAATQNTDAPGIHLYDLRTGKVQGTIDSPQGSQGRVAFSPDGKTLAVIWPDIRRGASHFEWYDVATRRRLQAIDNLPADRPATIIFSPDSQKVAAYLDHNSLAWWDVKTGKRLGSIPLPKDTAVHSGDFSPDGRSLVLDMGNGTAILYELSTRQPRHLYGGQRQLPANRAGLDGVRGFHGGDAATRVAFSPDGKVVAHAGLDRKVHLYDPLSSTEIKALVGHSGSVLAIAFAPDGKTLASASADTTVLLWDLTGVAAASRASSVPPLQDP